VDSAVAPFQDELVVPPAAFQVSQERIPGYSESRNEKMRRLCRESLSQGWAHFKLKVGGNPADDLRRAQ
jgi:L-fuconate dehydratase